MQETTLSLSLPFLQSFFFFSFFHNFYFNLNSLSLSLTVLFHLLITTTIVMVTELLQVDPSKLKFVFELKKQSSCLIQLANKVDQYIAFKVKTTSPKKYCVRPKIGIIKPEGKCDFTVTMQGQPMAPPGMQCKDKFLILSTVVSFGMTEDDITPDTFTKDSWKYVEEKKLKVVLISPPSSPVLLPVNGDMKHDPSNQANDVLKDRMLNGIENIPPPIIISAEVKGLEPASDTREDKKDEDNVPRHAEVVGDMKLAKEDVQLNLVKGCEELKSKLCMMDSKLREAEVTMMKLNEERLARTKEKDLLNKELEMVLKRKSNAKVQAGFPLMFVCMVALVGVAVGYYIHP